MESCGVSITMRNYWTFRMYSKTLEVVCQDLLRYFKHEGTTITSCSYLLYPLVNLNPFQFMIYLYCLYILLSALHIQKILGTGLNKTRRNSNWELRPLSHNQVFYFCLPSFTFPICYNFYDCPKRFGFITASLSTKKFSDLIFICTDQFVCLFLLCPLLGRGCA